MTWACWLAVVGLWLGFAWTLPPTSAVALNDFVGYYKAGDSFALGEVERLYEPGRKWFTNLPVVSALFAPLGSLPYPTAWLLFWWIQLVAWGATYALLLYGLQRHFPPFTAPRVLAATVVFLAFAPVMRRCLVQGQTTPIMLLLMTGSWLLLHARRSKAAGVLMGVVCIIKIPPMLLVGGALARRRLALSLTALALVVFAVVVSWLAFPSELLGQYAERVITSNAGRGHAAFNNRSLEAFWLRLLTDRSLLDWYPLPSPPWVAFVSFASSFGLLTLVAWRGRRLWWPSRAPDDSDGRTGSLELELALGSALMLLVFPIVWIHYALFLALPLTVLPFWWMARQLPARPLVVVVLLLGWWLVSGTEVPSNVAVGSRLYDPVFRLAQSAQTLGAVLLVLGLLAPLGAIASRTREDVSGWR